MKHIAKKEVIVIAGKEAETFQEEVNKVLERLAEEEIEADLNIDTNPLTAVITYTRHLRRAEDIVDEYNLKGVYAHCYDCEQFERDPDGRKRVGYCRAHSNLVRRSDSACSTYYEMKSRWEDD